jgi:hypothetical protein
MHANSSYKWWIDRIPSYSLTNELICVSSIDQNIRGSLNSLRTIENPVYVRYFKKSQKRELLDPNLQRMKLQKTNILFPSTSSFIIVSTHDDILPFLQGVNNNNGNVRSSNDLNSIHYLLSAYKHLTQKEPSNGKKKRRKILLNDHKR